MTISGQLVPQLRSGDGVVTENNHMTEWQKALHRNYLHAQYSPYQVQMQLCTRTTNCTPEVLLIYITFFFWDKMEVIIVLGIVQGHSCVQVHYF